MQNEYTRKISRGQVWFLIDPDLPAVHYRDSVQGKNRPWLIVSNDCCNQNSTVYTAVPITSQSKNYFPTHVTYKIDGDREQTILCEQIRTIPERLLYNQGSSYRYTLSDSTMDKVDEALSVQLDLKLVMPNADKFWKSIESMIRVKIKELMSVSKIEALDVSKIAAIIDKRTNEIFATIEENSSISVTETSTVEIKETPVEEPTKPKKKRNVWNDANKKKLLDDYYKHGVDYCSTQYNLNKPNIYQLVSKFKKELNNGIIGQN